MNVETGIDTDALLCPALKKKPLYSTGDATQCPVMISREGNTKNKGYMYTHN